MTRLFLLALLALLVLPAAALAAPVKISPHASALSQAGVATVEVANPNRYALRGTASVAVRGRTVAGHKVRLAKRSVTSVKLRFDRQATAMEARADIIRAALEHDHAGEPVPADQLDASQPVGD